MTNLLDQLIAEVQEHGERFRLIRTQGRAHSWYVWGTEKNARDEAEQSFRETDIPVLIVRAPKDGLVRQVGQVGKVEKKAPKRKEAA